VMLRARWVTLRACWVTLRARWVTLRARWVTLRALWVMLRTRWVTLRARWVTLWTRPPAQTPPLGRVPSGEESQRAEVCVRLLPPGAPLFSVSHRGASPSVATARDAPAACSRRRRRTCRTRSANRRPAAGVRIVCWCSPRCPADCSGWARTWRPALHASPTPPAMSRRTTAFGHAVRPARVD
jgi:hypothetical protein